MAASSGVPLKPPLLEYWKPPKPVAFAPSSVNEENGNIKNKRATFTTSGRSQQQQIFPANLKIQPTQNGEITSGVSSLVSSPGFRESRRNNRFTWSDSTTTLLHINDIESNVSLISIPWGRDEKQEKVGVKVSEREIITPANMAACVRFKVSAAQGSRGSRGMRQLQGPGDLQPPWWQFQYWGIKKMLIVWFCVAATIALIVTIAVSVTNDGGYPDYYKLNYTMVDQISTGDFFDNFDFFNGTDPTHGFVQYVDQKTAQNDNLTNYNINFQSGTLDGDAIPTMRVDTSDTNAINGRKSVRITSKKSWNHGLFIFDVKHTPYGCATWPALWLSDVYNWPLHGEIDVMEQVNQATSGNIMTLHTTAECQMNAQRRETGTVSNTDCYNVTNDNSGCGVTAPSNTFGEAFNKNGGGVMAVELRPEGIRMWQFNRTSIPTNITTAPDPSTWGTALADFPHTNCIIGDHFSNLTIIVNIEICGDWAGDMSVYNDQDQCPGTCTEFATRNASAFANAYWEFGNFTIFQAPGLTGNQTYYLPQDLPGGGRPI